MVAYHQGGERHRGVRAARARCERASNRDVIRSYETGREELKGTAMLLFDQALGALNNRRFQEAENLFRNILSKDARNFDALHMLGIVCSETGKVSDAENFFLTAISIDARFPPLFHNYGLFLAKLRRYQESIDQFNKALALSKNYAPVYCDRGISLMELGRLEESLASHNTAAALAPNVPMVFYNRANTLFRQRNFVPALRDYDRAIAIYPNYADAYCGRGNVLLELKRYDDASAAYDKALALNPDLENAWLGRGNVLGQLMRYDDALAAYDKALALRPDLENAWLGRGNVFGQLRRYDDALAAYDRALALRPGLETAWLGRGNVFLELKRYDDAMAAYDKALALAPALENAWLGRGNVFGRLERYDDAFAAYDRALSLAPDLAEALYGCGYVFSRLKRYDEALATFDKAHAIKPGLTSLESSRLHTKMQLCDWSNFDAEYAHLISTIKSGNVEPFPLLAIPSSPGDQLQCASLWAANKYCPSDRPVWRGERFDHDRIRVAYISADFRDHPVAYLLAGMFEQHDRARFETTAISFGPGNQSEMRTRLRNSFDRFIDVGGQSDIEVARSIRALEIDIAVDLMGHTANSRPEVLACRPSPIQVNYLGYPGTMGAAFIDYIIADRYLVPDHLRSAYSENVVYLPDTFQANDSKRPRPDYAPSRARMGLPEGGFVFCSFNNAVKIIPSVFDAWMQVMRQVGDSVLWMLAEGAAAERNIRREAEARGVAPSRLVFAPRVPYADYLARYRCADLFLDTSPFNGGTTVSDALWTGLPVVTCSGEAFASRMAGSLLNAAGLPELVTGSLAEYAQLTLTLATDRNRLAAIRAKLDGNRTRCSLFDTGRFRRHIEAAYITMHQRYQRGEPPASFAVAPAPRESA
jgi:protein O-GlcNAc transferase